MNMWISQSLKQSPKTKLLGLIEIKQKYDEFFKKGHEINFRPLWKFLPVCTGALHDVFFAS